jgi:hypothetical protein
MDVLLTDGVGQRARINLARKEHGATWLRLKDSDNGSLARTMISVVNRTEATLLVQRLIAIVAGVVARLE